MPHTFAKVTLSARIETGNSELSIPVFKQQSYTGTIPAVSSTLANTPCVDLGVSGVLEKFDAALGTAYSFRYEDDDIPFHRSGEITPPPSSKLPHSVIEPYIERNDDFGSAYAYLFSYWYSVTGFEHWLDDIGYMKEPMHFWEKEDQEMRRDALANGRITSKVPPRRLWDLRANRAVPWHWCVRARAGAYPWAISHAWVDAEERADVWTPMNGYRWPVPIPKDANLDLIRIEMLNLGVDYVWLDVLCLRQPGGREEHLRLEEWKIDVPTIGEVFRKAEKVV